MKTFSRHKLNFFERITDPMRFGNNIAPPEKLFSFIIHFSKQIKLTIFCLFVLQLLTVLIDLSLPLVFGIIINQILETNDIGAMIKDNFYYMLGYACLFLILRPLVQILTAALVDMSLMTGFANIVRWQSHLNVLGLDLSYFTNELAGRLANRVIETGQAVRGVVLKFFEVILYMILYFGGAIFILAQSSLILAIPSFLWSLVFLYVLVFLMPKVRDLSHKHSLLRSKMTGRIVDSYANIGIVKLFARKNHEIDGAAEAIDDFNFGWARVMRISFLMEFLMSISNAMLIVGTVGFGLFLLTQDIVTITIVAAAFPLSYRIGDMSHWIMWEISFLFENIGTIDEGKETISKKPTVIDAKNAENLSVHKGQIEFKNVKFNYGMPGGLFEALNFKIKPGEKVGLVGRSGSGKSSIVNLLLRLYDLDDGQILIDNNDISKVTQDSLRSNIAVVTQDTALLHRSIKDNILYGNPNADDEELFKAAKQAEAYDFILDLEDKDGRKGFDAYVGERGVRLSGGQRQRIAIARVILKNAPILVLDEATRALDSEVESAIQTQLTNILENRTSLVIAHRLSTINKLDRLIVMDQGKIIEVGTHNELIKNKGHYSKLWSLQSGGFLPTADDPKLRKKTNII